MELTSMDDNGLASAWLEAKEEENKANAKRLLIEQEIDRRFGHKEEGAETHTLSSGVKIEISGKLTYKVDDTESLVNACKGIPVELRPLKVKTELDETGAKWIRSNQPELWKIIAPFITVKPAKTAIKVKL